MGHPYATPQQILDAYPPALTALGVGSFDVTTSQMNSYYIWTAQGVVDGWIASRYTVPIAGSSPLITKCTVDLVIYDLFRDRGLRIPDFMQERYDQTIAMLGKIAEGKIKLPGETEVTTGDNEAFSSRFDYHPVFSPVLDDIYQSEDRDFVQQQIDERAEDYNDFTSVNS